jgi:hypothetical protein
MKLDRRPGGDQLSTSTRDASCFACQTAPDQRLAERPYHLVPIGGPGGFDAAQAGLADRGGRRAPRLAVV